MKLRNLTTASIFAIATTYTNQDTYALQYPYLFVCQSCAAGTYSDGTLEKCKECPAGQYSTGNASSCSTCNAGTYSNKGANQTGSTGCSGCGAGTYSTKGSSTCTACPVGQYQDKAGQSSCSSCASTSYGAWGGTCGRLTRTMTTYCTKTGSTSSTANASSTTVSGSGSCSGHTYCSAQVNGTCISCSKQTHSDWNSSDGCGYTCHTGYTGSDCHSCGTKTGGYWTDNRCNFACNAGYYKSGNNCKLSLYAYERRVGLCNDNGNNTYSSVVTYTYIGEANDGFSRTVDTEWVDSKGYYWLVYDFSTNNLGNRSVPFSCPQGDAGQFPRNYDPDVYNGGLHFVDRDSYFYKSTSGGVNTYTTFTRK